MVLAASRCARLLNRSDLARDAGLPQPTDNRYLNLLETGCLLVRLAPFTTNPTTGLVKGKKMLWNDCGLAAWLAGIKSRPKSQVDASQKPNSFGVRKSQLHSPIKQTTLWVTPFMFHFS